MGHMKKLNTKKTVAFQKNARNVTGVSFDTLQTSAAMYLGMKEVLKSEMSALLYQP